MSRWNGRKIWVIFSVANGYEQHYSNLVAWWSNKPTLGQITNAINCCVDDYELLKYSIEYGDEVRVGGCVYRLEEINDGIYEKLEQ